MICLEWTTKGVDFKKCEGFLCVYTGLVDMFVVNMVNINGIDFSPAHIIIFKHYVKTIIWATETLQQIFPLKSQLRFYMDTIALPLYCSICDKVKRQ